MRYPTASEVIAFNEQVDGPGGLVDFGLLESAILRPQASAFGRDAYPDIHAKAAALFHSLARNHAFFNGNKRTAVVTVGFFYALNGWWLEAAQGEVVALAVDTAEGLLDVPAIAHWLKEHAWPVSEPEGV